MLLPLTACGRARRPNTKPHEIQNIQKKPYRHIPSARDFSVQSSKSMEQRDKKHKMLDVVYLLMCRAMPPFGVIRPFVGRAMPPFGVIRPFVGRAMPPFGVIRPAMLLGHCTGCHLNVNEGCKSGVLIEHLPVF
jgi:hypothetical protein